MNKRQFIAPYILLTGGLNDGGEGNVIGGGTGQGGVNPFPMSYEDWVNSGFQYGYDFDGDNEYSLEEFASWWEDNGFTEDQWEEFNHDHAWPL